jgi:hypothetical protein
VRPGELLVVHLVARVTEQADNASAAAVDGEHSFGRPVRHPDPGLALLHRRRGEPGEKARTASARSPLARPRDRAYDAPSEKPDRATRDTACRAKRLYGPERGGAARR